MRRVYSLDLLKIIATFCILGFHYQGIMQYTSNRGINFAFKSNLYANVVELFFIISGFFLANGINGIKKGEITFGKYFLQKYFRFWPICFVTAFLCYISERIRYELMGSYLNDNISLWKAVESAFLVNEGGMFPRSGVNSPTWYLSVLLICFAVFYFLTWISVRVRIDESYLYFLMIVFGASLFRVVSLDNDIPFFNYQCSRGYTCVFLGILIRRVIYDNKYNLSKIHEFFITSAKGALVLLCVAAVALFKAIASDSLDDWWFIYVFCLFPSLVLLMLNVRIKDSFLKKCSFLGVVSEISFDVYVWHIFLLNIWVMLDFYEILPFNMHTSFGLVCFWICVWVFGAISHYAFTKPVDKYFKRKKLI